MVSEKLIQELSELPKSRLVDKNQLPTRMSERKMTPFSFMLMWMGTSILLAVFTNAANMFPSLGIGQILGAVALGNLITVITLAINGDIGITYGLNFPVYLRSIFGYTGCRRIGNMNEACPCSEIFLRNIVESSIHRHIAAEISSCIGNIGGDTCVPQSLDACEKQCRYGRGRIKEARIC